ncbi:MAG: ABC transporter permease [Methanoregula sp.]|jgi:ABC-2 type transport system permease protein
MTSIFPAVWSESLKMYRSKMLWISILVFLFIPFMMGVVMFVVKNPEFAGKLGLIGTKAAILRFENTDWQTYFGLLNQITAGAGFGFAFVTSWVFGREYSDRTVKDLLALPVPRSSIVAAKFIIVAIWCAFLSLMLFSSGLIVGGLLRFPGWSDEIAFQSVSLFMVTSLLTILLCTPIAFFAGYGRGYLPPIGFAILMFIIAQFTGLVGLGPYFPWGIPLLYATPAGAEGIQSGMISFIILFLTSLLGLTGTLAWWRYADQY